MLPLRSSSLLIALVTAGFAFAALCTSRNPAADKADATATVGQVIQDIPEFGTWPELRMKDMFESPVGDRGLAYSSVAKSLDGRQVRITGFMAQTDWKDHGEFLLATFPLILHDREYGQADEIPSGAVLVKMPPGETAAFTKGLLMLAGTLKLGRVMAPGERPVWAVLELHPDAKHWHPGPSLLAHLAANEKVQIRNLLMKQTSCSCRQCNQARAPRNPS